MTIGGIFIHAAAIFLPYWVASATRFFSLKILVASVDRFFGLKFFLASADRFLLDCKVVMIAEFIQRRCFEYRWGKVVGFVKPDQNPSG